MQLEIMKHWIWLCMLNSRNQWSILFRFLGCTMISMETMVCCCWLARVISLMRTSVFRWFRLSRTSEQDLSSRTLHMLLTHQNWEEKTYIKGWLSSIKMASKLWTNTLKEKELSWCFTSMKFILLMRAFPHLSKKCG